MREHLGTNPFHDTGVPVQGFKGVPQDQGRGQFGVPIPGQGKQSRPEPKVAMCLGMTKKGEPCKARPITDGEYCIGHQRQIDAN